MPDRVVTETSGVAVRSAERIVTLTDAVVAIAMTLLVLPLVELVPEVDPDHLGSSLSGHRDVFIGFVVSFLVIHAFWSAHEPAFARVDVAGAALRVTNMLWLLVVAFLPFPTALIGRHSTTTTTPFYIGTMCVLSVLTSTMSTMARRSAPPSPAPPSPAPTDRLDAARMAFLWATPVVLAACAGIAAVAPDAGLFALLLLVVLGRAQGFTLRRLGG